MDDSRLIRVMIVDDEASARQNIGKVLSDDPEITIIGEYPGGDEAVNVIRHKRPDILFLEVQLPGKDGFAFLQDVGQELMPLVIFVTANENYAVQAFRFKAMDYVLKPVDRQRLMNALQHAKARLRRAESNEIDQRILSLMREGRVEHQYLQRVLVKTGGRISFLRFEDVDWIEARGDYVGLHARGKKHLLREKIGNLELRLPPHKFMRIHRSTIVNIDKVKELHALRFGEYSVLLLDGARLTMSRSFREKVFEQITRSS
jgi:two-component system LytT family response regulator